MSEKQNLIIVGANGFGGINSYFFLKNNFKLTRIDKKDYFEYSPTILEALCLGEEQYKKMSFPVDDKDSYFGVGVQSIDFNRKVVLLENDIELSYDVIVITTGSSYGCDIKFSDEDLNHVNRSVKINLIRDKIKTANKIWLEGAGGVGIEFASEIWYRYCSQKDAPKKEIVLEYRSDVIPRFSEKARIFVKQWMQKRGIRTIKSSDVDQEEKNAFDLIIDCHSWKPNTSFLDSQYLDEKGQVKVNEYLEIEGTKDAYAIGDCNNSKAEKRMGAARHQAKFLSSNLSLKAKGKQLKKYSLPGVAYSFSLGPKEAIALTYNKIIATGGFPSFTRRLTTPMVYNRLTSAKRVNKKN